MPAWESEPADSPSPRAAVLSAALPADTSQNEIDPAMELYLFVWGTLAWTVTIAVLWPVNVPLAWVSYRIWHGTKPIDEEMQEELWRRAAWGSGLIGVSALVFVVFDYILWNWAGLPSGPVHLIVYLSLVALATWVLMLYFALEDFFQGLSMLLLYFYLPVFVLWLPNRLFGMWDPLLGWVKAWLEKPT
jgi:hypothetical protein